LTIKPGRKSAISGKTVNYAVVKIIQMN